MDYEELNEKVKKAQYAVRGELYLRASQLQKEGKKIIFTNVGNPHALGQKPLTFPRQVRVAISSASHPHGVGCSTTPSLLSYPDGTSSRSRAQVVALCQAPFLLDDPNVGLMFPPDAIVRAKRYLAMAPGGLGAYSDARGIPGIRKEVADFIHKRDGYPRLDSMTFTAEILLLVSHANASMLCLLAAVIQNSFTSQTAPAKV
jgi:glutamate--glyoxylate aminotransferase